MPDPSVQGRGLCSLFLRGVFRVLRRWFGGAIQLENRVHPDLPDGLFRVGLLALVLAAAQLAPDLDMSTLLERGGELTELAEADATVPFRVLDVLAVLLVRRFGCQRESGEAAVVVGANFCVAAEESDEGDFVLVHCGDLRFVEFPVSCSGHPSRSERVAPAPKAEALHLRRVRPRRKP